MRNPNGNQSQSASPYAKKKTRRTRRGPLYSWRREGHQWALLQCNSGAPAGMPDDTSVCAVVHREGSKESRAHRCVGVSRLKSAIARSRSAPTPHLRTDDRVDEVSTAIATALQHCRPSVHRRTDALQGTPGGSRGAQDETRSAPDARGQRRSHPHAKVRTCPLPASFVDSQ